MLNGRHGLRPDWEEDGQEVGGVFKLGTSSRASIHIARKIDCKK